ncbi:MAG: triose-phosphate isomerase, partial [Planctomycetes bacterium]|nr:triose-phosphate isomerase [Planctomycetota bacterium]
AIGTGEVATLEQIGAAHACIRKFLAAKIEAEIAQTVRVLYGGSVKPDNAAAIMALPDVDGLLVGGASLKPDTFIPIVEFDS